MPISKERKKLYPDNWKEIRKKILDRAGNCCELCGAHNKLSIHRHKKYPAKYISTFSYIIKSDYITLTNCYVDKSVKVVLTIHHINNDPTDNRKYNLLALCQRCHNKLDAPFRADKRRKAAK